MGILLSITLVSLELSGREPGGGHGSRLCRHEHEHGHDHEHEKGEEVDGGQCFGG